MTSILRGTSGVSASPVASTTEPHSCFKSRSGRLAEWATRSNSSLYRRRHRPLPPDAMGKTAAVAEMAAAGAAEVDVPCHARQLRRVNPFDTPRAR